MVKEDKFFKVPGKPWGFYFESGKIDNLKENDFVFIGCGKWSFFIQGSGSGNVFGNHEDCLFA